MARPVLGIICCTRPVGDGAEPAQTVVGRYLEGALGLADAAGLLVPALPQFMQAEEVVGRLDGLFLTGSPSNIETHHYGPGDAAAEGPFDPGRDAMALALVRLMRAQGKPVLGVCRGFQEINVALGGSLRRDMATPTRLHPHHAPPGVSFTALFDHQHRVTLTEGGRLRALYEVPEITVNSVHYQGIDALAPLLAVEAQAPDGVIEAVREADGGAPVLAVQWHPEWQGALTPHSRALFGLMGRLLRGGRV